MFVSACYIDIFVLYITIKYSFNNVCVSLKMTLTEKYNVLSTAQYKILHLRVSFRDKVVGACERPHLKKHFENLLQDLEGSLKPYGEGHTKDIRYNTVAGTPMRETFIQTSRNIWEKTASASFYLYGEDRAAFDKRTDALKVELNTIIQAL